MTFWETLRDNWAAEGIPVPPGATDAEIEAFEARYEVRLPDDMRAYFQTVNGMWAEGQPEQYDDYGFDSFWPVGRLMPWCDHWAGPTHCNDPGEKPGGRVIGSLDEPSDTPEPRTLFPFADHSLFIYAAVIDLSADPMTHVHVYRIFCADHKRYDDFEPVGRTFTEFMQSCLKARGLGYL